MLEEAKFPFDQTLTFYIAAGNSITERTAALIVQDLQKVGVKVQIEQVDVYKRQEKHPVTEFKNLVKTFHKEGLELIIELYFCLLYTSRCV